MISPLPSGDGNEEPQISEMLQMKTSKLIFSVVPDRLVPILTPKASHSWMANRHCAAPDKEFAIHS